MSRMLDLNEISWCRSSPNDRHMFSNISVELLYNSSPQELKVHLTPCLQTLQLKPTNVKPYQHPTTSKGTPSISTLPQLELANTHIQGFLVVGTAVAAGLSGFYLYLLRNKRIQEETGTNPFRSFSLRFPSNTPTNPLSRRTNDPSQRT